MRITERVTISRPTEDVWPAIADLGAHPHWRPAVVELRQLSDGPLAVGSQVREVLRWAGRELELADEVTALEPERLLGMHGEWSAASFDLELRLTPSDGGTSVTFDWSLAPRSLLMRIATPFLGRPMRRSTVEELEGLKAYVEGGSVGAGHASSV
jgi:uncharacterized protein YndB with AHSA1/START domain